MWARIPTIVTLVSLHSMPCAGAETISSKWAKLDDTKLSLTISAQPPGEEPVQVMAKVLFTKQFAVSAVQDPDTATGIRWEHALLFDLDRMAWYDAAQQRWVDLKSGQAWEKATLERTKRNLALSSDEQTRAFIQAITDPQFDVQKEDDGTIVISNSHLTYSIIPAQKISPELLERFLAYDVLNAYNKAIEEKKLPPTPQVAVDDILAQHKILPWKMTAKIKTLNGSVVFTTETKVEPFDESDKKLVQDAISGATNDSP